jgi:hypothetical protein
MGDCGGLLLDVVLKILDRLNKSCCCCWIEELDDVLSLKIPPFTELSDEMELPDKRCAGMEFDDKRCTSCDIAKLLRGVGWLELVALEIEATLFRRLWTLTSVSKFTIFSNNP